MDPYDPFKFLEHLCIFPGQKTVASFVKPPGIIPI